MYECISGKIIELKPTHVVIDVQGVGYFINISLTTFSELQGKEKNCSVYVHLVVREDDLRLYGFSEKEERQIFRLLISISGIGPRVAMTVLSGIGVEKFKEAVSSANLVALTSISGIGKKTAERLIIELREKIGEFCPGTIDAGSASGVITSEKSEDVLSALIALGYKRAEASKAVNKAFESNPDGPVEILIREALNYIK
ncbi:MAG: Holliday junction branch migration protein RuvA [Candidatus Omnitrophica bacterium]|nr:Holliday junction branch migration protein RuvA [Candidatus Omnitrophota bacterium]